MKPFDDNPGPVPSKGIGPELKRSIPKDHPYDPSCVKPLAKCLYSLVAAHGHGLSAYREFSRLKSVSISPDGMLGGKGYVMRVREIRSKLHEACEILSGISDAIYDEIHAEHWKPRLSELSENDAEDIKNFVDEAKEILVDPEGFGDSKSDKIEQKNDGPEGDDPNKPYRGPKEVSHQPESSALPGGGNFSDAYTSEVSTSPYLKKASVTAFDYFAGGSSSLPVNTIPGGPRVDHVGPGEGQGPRGSFNTLEPPTEDDWGLDIDPDLPHLATSRLPYDYFKGPSRVDDFGLGDSDQDGVDIAPELVHSRLPEGLTPRQVGTPSEVYVRYALDQDAALGEPDSPDLVQWEQAESSTLPGDEEPWVARADYYPPNRGSLVTSSPKRSFKPLDDPDIDLPGHASRHQDTINQYIKYEQRIRDYRP